MNTDKAKPEETHCHPERASCAKDLCNSSVLPSVLCVEGFVLDPGDPRKSVVKRI
jgi:hypothetical protein